jgi:hypothetical protein
MLVGSILLAATGSCGRFHSGAEPGTGPTTIVFQNESLDQADLFAVRRSAGALRIGTVMAGRTDTLQIGTGEIPAGESVDFVARLLARRSAPHSGLVAVLPGQWLTVTLPSTANILSVLPGQPPAAAR